MSIPDHAIWRELESYFQTPIASDDRMRIVDILSRALNEDPNVDLNYLTLEVAAAVLKK